MRFAVLCGLGCPIFMVRWFMSEETLIDAISIGVNGEIKKHSISGYQDIKNIIGGWIEMVGIRLLQLNAYLDEEGKLKQLPINHVATQFAKKFQAIPTDDWICGTMLIVGPVDSDGNDTSIPSKLIEAVSDAIKVCGGKVEIER